MGESKLKDINDFNDLFEESEDTDIEILEFENSEIIRPKRKRPMSEYVYIAS